MSKEITDIDNSNGDKMSLQSDNDDLNQMSQEELNAKREKFFKRSDLQNIKLISRSKKPNLLGTRVYTEEKMPTDYERKQIFKDQKEYHHIFNKWRDFDTLTTFFSMVGLVLAIVNYETAVSEKQIQVNTELHATAMQHPRNNCQWKQLLQMIALFTTIISITCLYIREQYKTQWLNKYLLSNDENPHQIDFMYDDIVNANKDKCEFTHQNHWFNKYFFFDFFILFISPIPFYDAYVTMEINGGDSLTFFLNDFLFAFMFLRLYQFVRSLFNYSIYTDPLSKKVCKDYGFSAGTNFAIQSKILIDPFQTCFIMFFGTVFIFAYLVRIFELPYLLQTEDGTNFESFFNAMWFTVVTLTTIGYGDVSPGTIPGKIVTIILAFWGTIFVALLVTVVSNIFDLKQNHQKALRRIRLTRQAASAIVTSIKYFRVKKDLHVKLYQQQLKNKHIYGDKIGTPFLKLVKMTSQQRDKMLKQQSKDDGCHHSQHTNQPGSNDHEHEDYFTREVNKAMHMHISEKSIFEQKKKVYQTRQELLQKLRVFQQEKRDFRNLCDDNTHDAIHTKMNKELYNISDRLELMEQSMKDQQSIIQQQLQMLLSQQQYQQQQNSIQENPDKVEDKQYANQQEQEHMVIPPIKRDQTTEEDTFPNPSSQNNLKMNQAKSHFYNITGSKTIPELQFPQEQNSSSQINSYTNQQENQTIEAANLEQLNNQQDSRNLQPPLSSSIQNSSKMMNQTQKVTDQVEYIQLNTAALDQIQAQEISLSKNPNSKIETLNLEEKINQNEKKRSKLKSFKTLVVKDQDSNLVFDRISINNQSLDQYMQTRYKKTKSPCKLNMKQLQNKQMKSQGRSKYLTMSYDRKKESQEKVFRVIHQRQFSYNNLSQDNRIGVNEKKTGKDQKFHKKLNSTVPFDLKNQNKLEIDDILDQKIIIDQKMNAKSPKAQSPEASVLFEGKQSPADKLEANEVPWQPLPPQQMRNTIVHESSYFLISQQVEPKHITQQALTQRSMNSYSSDNEMEGGQQMNQEQPNATTELPGIFKFLSSKIAASTSDPAQQFNGYFKQNLNEPLLQFIDDDPPDEKMKQ